MGPVVSLVVKSRLIEDEYKLIGFDDTKWPDDRLRRWRSLLAVVKVGGRDKHFA